MKVTRGGKTRAGFSLLEVLAGLFATVVAIAAFVPASVRSRHAFAHNRHTELATVTANAVLEKEKALGYASIPLGASTLPAVATQPDLPNISGNVTVDYVNPYLKSIAADLGRKRVDVTVTWNDKLGDRGAVTLTTIIAND